MIAAARPLRRAHSWRPLLIQKYKEKPINLEALFSGGNPFDEAPRAKHNGDVEVDTDSVPF
jgi:hypothetical protein